VAEKQNKQTDGNGGATQTQLISKLPPVLTIQLQRYTDDLSKFSEHVSFKEILHVGPFMDPRY
jgi:ubiquitin carboxyl-terminal hydrolase 16/45